ncbi:PREDICTED: BTB/POZ domain-containing protein KCTD12 [Polistes dominula]|uniref:BTB/POZ domain-containing protein KCTD12 n=1 Tax=Polistes dominula TaxID=743375 RepID=A0ABM1I2E2_POLDO|nr:PREDICTED: BTB/POZ domain-containing protein KCTD12 [Polistes dominula]
MVDQQEETQKIVDLNVGGVSYTTTLETLTKDSTSRLGLLFIQNSPIPKDSSGKYFFDRDGNLFRYILDYLRDEIIVLPEGLKECERLRNEADYYGLANLIQIIDEKIEDVAGSSTCRKRTPGCITIGYRGSFAFGREGLTEVNFRKISRILVCGRVALCRDVFGETLNESRDPNHGLSDRYTSRFFLKHNFIEQAFDMLQEQGFKLAGSCGSSTAGGNFELYKAGVDFEETRWNHYNEFVFIRD